jgi:hypothetical protein
MEELPKSDPSFQGGTYDNTSTAQKTAFFVPLKKKRTFGSKGFKRAIGIIAILAGLAAFLWFGFWTVMLLVAMPMLGSDANLQQVFLPPLAYTSLGLISIIIGILFVISSLRKSKFNA